ncbi:MULTISPECIES: hypothetical protein [Streptomyces]|uniref:Uncharacterized protein n=1 Tax=Streptomyces siderophoricus TaxID=2802281 RepID=A0ABS1MQE2_9ACTN|nr:hypothetical protein [Streptomyces sp. 9-7]MBL1089998.1 hypothetical protein [Streptomyces sp. 9-7]
MADSPLGRDGRHDHNSVQLTASWPEAGLGRRSAAATRARTVLDDHDHDHDHAHGDADGAADGERETVQRHRADARALLDRVW